MAHADVLVMVSNFNHFPDYETNLEDWDTAQSFDTGGNPTGYILTSIELKITTSLGETTPPTLKLRSGSATGTVVATLTGPAALNQGESAKPTSTAA